MEHKCLYCYKIISTSESGDFHEKCSLKFFGNKNPPQLQSTLNEMKELAKEMVDRGIAVPGVQPKLSMSFDPKKDKRLTIVGALGGNYILKPPFTKFPEMPENEHLSMRLAELFGIKTVMSSLIKLKSGELGYLTKRIDRKDTGEKTHMLDMLQILEVSDKYIGSMEQIGKAIGKYSDRSLLDKVRFFELSVFCFLIGNNDMHLKNFSMIKDSFGWTLSPAYDLLNIAILDSKDTEDFALTIGGKKKKVSKDILKNFGQNLTLNEKQINQVFDGFVQNEGAAYSLIDQSFLSPVSKKAYKQFMNKRYDLLNVS